MPYVVTRQKAARVLERKPGLADEMASVRAVLANVHMQERDHELALDDDMFVFAIQFGFLVSFGCAAPCLALLGFLIDLVLVRASVFKMLYVQRREVAATRNRLYHRRDRRLEDDVASTCMRRYTHRHVIGTHRHVIGTYPPCLQVPFAASGLGGWNSMLEIITLGAVLSNALLITAMVSRADPGEAGGGNWSGLPEEAGGNWTVPAEGSGCRMCDCPRGHVQVISSPCSRHM